VRTIVGLGETLWDLLPTGKQLGGAPANFAFHAAQLGHRGVVASAVGRDPLGAELTGRFAELGLTTEFVLEIEDRPTGTVLVELDAAGHPAYTIVEGVAWDAMPWNAAWARLAGRTDAVCFGTLARRSPRSREAIERFLEACSPRALAICDLNLRGRFFDEALVRRSFELARVVKLNQEELWLVAPMLGLKPESEESAALALRERYGLELICLTRGAAGCLIVGREAAAAHPGFPVEVADTVGSGDAFTAAVAHHYLAGSPLAEIARAANRLGAFVATRPGATPTLPEAVRAEVLGSTVHG